MTGDKYQWDDEEPFGVAYNSHSRRWHRSWNHYVVIMVSMIGLFLAIGAIGFFTFPRLLGALCVLAGAGAVSRSDRAAAAAARSHDTHFNELVWLLAAATLIAAGLAMVALPTAY
ncbi:MAG: hypothetical protein WKF50_05960 [Nocardioides sp.]